jgi:transposase
VSNDITYVGLDAHKKSIAVAMLVPGGKSPVEWEVANDDSSIRRLARRLKQRSPGEIRCCYEAGPTGYGLKRTLEGAGDIICEVVAPSLIPMKAGDRVKTDRRDARKLAELLRANLLTEVRAPTPEEEAARDLCRCREDAKEDQTRARHRLSKFLLRGSLIYTEGREWTTRHRQWMEKLKFEHDAAKATFDDYMHALDVVGERLSALDAKLEELSKREPFAQPVGWLRCFHGIDTTTAMMITAELHDVRRFESARSLMAYLGLVPSEHSSGGRVMKGAITKTGNKHVRRLLVEAAHHARHRPAIGPKLKKRRSGQTSAAVALADRAQVRLHRKYWKLVNAGKQPNKARVAVAREFAGFIWAALRGAAGLNAEQTDGPPMRKSRQAASGGRSSAARSNPAVGPRAKAGRGRPAGPGRSNPVVARSSERGKAHTG